MGLPTGVEVKSEPAVKVEEAVVAVTAEEVKPAATPTETAGAAPESAEVSAGR